MRRPVDLDVSWVNYRLLGRTPKNNMVLTGLGLFWNAWKLLISLKPRGFVEPDCEEKGKP